MWYPSVGWTTSGSATPQVSPHNNTSSRKLLKMDVLTSETCWAVNWNIKASVIKLVYLYSNIEMMHGPIHIRFWSLFVNIPIRFWSLFVNIPIRFWSLFVNIPIRFWSLFVNIRMYPSSADFSGWCIGWSVNRVIPFISLCLQNLCVCVCVFNFTLSRGDYRPAAPSPLVAPLGRDCFLWSPFQFVTYRSLRFPTR